VVEITPLPVRRHGAGPFDFLTDEHNAAARTLKIEMRDGLPMGMTLLGYDKDTVFPTVIIVDHDGIIRWVDQTDNYRVRPEPDTFLPIIRQLAKRGGGPTAAALAS
jgi:hypothetical protein